MARIRKRRVRVPETHPPSKDAGGQSDKDITLLALPDRQFNTVIRFINQGSLGRVQQLSPAVSQAMKRLRQKRDGKQAVKGVPDGSDQVDIQSLIVWLNKIGRRNRNAVAQVVAIDATCAARGA